MGLVIATETVDQVRHDIHTLIAAHWNEVGQDRERMRLDPDWDFYVAQERAGQLAVFTARQAGLLVGYAVFTVRRHSHYRTIKVAFNDLLYVMPASRRGTHAGISLLRGVEKMLVDGGARKIYYGVKAWFDYGPLLKKLGYAPIEVTWAKWVGG